MTQLKFDSNYTKGTFALQMRYFEISKGSFAGTLFAVLYNAINVLCRCPLWMRNSISL